MPFYQTNGSPEGCFEWNKKWWVGVPRNDDPVWTECGLEECILCEEKPVDQICGCEVQNMQFCNYDYGNTGFCETCSNFDTPKSCFHDGLPQQGAEDCVAKCFPNSDYFEYENQSPFLVRLMKNTAVAIFDVSVYYLETHAFKIMFDIFVGSILYYELVQMMQSSSLPEFIE